MEGTRVILEGLSDLDEEELREAVSPELVEFQRASVPQGALPEPATITAVVTLSSMAIAALTAYLSKQRRRRKLRERYRVVYPDGRIEEREFDLDERSEDALKAAILKQLGSWVVKDPSA